MIKQCEKCINCEECRFNEEMKEDCIPYDFLYFYRDPDNDNTDYTNPVDKK